MHTDHASGEHTHHHHNHGTTSHEHPEKPMDPDMLKAYLLHMLDHNEHHAEDLHSLIHQLQNAGHSDSVAAANRALDLFTKGNNELAQAIEKL